MSLRRFSIAIVTIYLLLFGCYNWNYS